MKKQELIERFKDKDYWFKNGKARSLKASVGYGGYGGVFGGYSHEGARIFIDPDTDRIYSFGTHFILAVRLNPKKQAKVIQKIVNPKYDGKQDQWKLSDKPDYWIEKTEPVKFLINGDRYSPTTTGHTNACIWGLKPNVQIPFSALDKAGITNYEDIVIIETDGNRWIEKTLTIPELSMTKDKLKEIEDSVNAHNTTGMMGDDDDEYFEDYPYTDIRFDDDKNSYIVTKMEHLLGSTLFRYGKRYFLSSTEHWSKMKYKSRWTRSYFLVELPRTVNTIEKAYLSLVPVKLRNLSEGDGYQRQGEWFFKPTQLSTRDIIQKFKPVTYRVTEVIGAWSKTVTKNTKKHKELKKWIKENIDTNSTPIKWITDSIDKTQVTAIQFHNDTMKDKFEDVWNKDGITVNIYPSGINVYHSGKSYIHKGKVIDNLWGLVEIGNPHTATDTIILDTSKQRVSFLVRKTIRHPEHRNLNLGKTWHEVYRSLAKASWSAEGKID